MAPDVSFHGDNTTNVNYSLNATWRGNYTAQEIPAYVYLMYYILWTFIAPIIFGIITVVGTIGNALVVYVILSRDGMQTVTNFLLLNLAFSDIAFLIICVPLTAYRYAASTWIFGELVCKVVNFVIYATACVTVYTLVGISVLRYFTVIHGMRTAQYRTKRNIIILIIVIWVVVLLVNVYTWLITKLKIFDDNFAYCGMETSSIKVFYLLFCVFGYAFPLVLICVLYLVIIRHLSKASGSSGMDQTRERTLRASKVIILVVAIFTLSWLPIHVNQLWSAYGQVPDGIWYEVFRIFCNCMAYGNSCANPLIYNFFAQDFKKAFREIMCCKRRQSNREWINGNATSLGNRTEKTAML